MNKSKTKKRKPNKDDLDFGTFFRTKDDKVGILKNLDIFNNSVRKLENDNVPNARIVAKDLLEKYSKSKSKNKNISADIASKNF